MTDRLTDRTLLGRRARLALAGAGAAIAVVLLLSIAPVRRAAAEFLGIFRVDRITVMPVSPEGVQQLEALGRELEGGLLGEPIVLREPSAPERVDDPAEAARRSGFEVKAVGDLVEGITLESVSVATGPRLRFEVDRAAAQMGLAAAGLGDVALPPLDTLWAEVDIAAMVEQRYSVDGKAIELVQAPSPVVTFPPGAPADRLGEAYLRVLGFSAEEAEEIAGDIDWASTLVIPMPEESGTYQKVAVGGAPAVLLREVTPERGDPEAVVLMWQDGGVLYGMTGAGIAPSLMLRAAESLR